MLRYVLMDLRLFDTSTDTPTSRKGLLFLLESLSAWNQLYLEENPETPKLYESGVEYAAPEQFTLPADSPLRPVSDFLLARGASRKVLDAFGQLRAMCGGEHFRDIPAVLDAQRVDCDNLCCYRVAELRNAGIKAMPYITWRQRPDGGMTYHALVRWPDGSSEDPSLILGMGGADRAAERAEELRKNAERLQIYKDVLAKERARAVGQRLAAVVPSLPRGGPFGTDGDGGTERDTPEEEVRW